MKKNSKKWKIVLTFVVLIIILLISGYIYLQNQNKPLYLVFKDYGSFKYEDDKWYNIDIATDKIFDKKFTVFIDNIKKGKYEIRYFSDRWYYFNDDRDSIDFTGDLFAYYSNKNISVANIEKQKLNTDDIEYLNKVLQKENIEVTNLDDYRINEKVILDIDADEKEETIYAVSNADVMENNGKVFSCLFYVKNDKVYTLKLDIYENQEEDYYLYSINNLFQMENNGKYFLSIIQFSDMTNENNGVSLYGLNMTNKYKLLIASNEKTANPTKKNKNVILILLIPVIIVILGGYIIYRKIMSEEID